MEPAEFRAMAAAVRELECGLGDGEKRPRPGEEPERRWARRSVYAARALVTGTVLAEADLKVVRPAIGLAPAAVDRLIGRRLVRPLAVDEPLAAEDVA
jgi:sialic acid synthase SpsE